jgi:hypothetical protein
MAGYEPVENPIPFPEAFSETGDVAAQSQAAVLLALGALLRFEEPHKTEVLSMAISRAPEDVEILPAEDREALNLPGEILRLQEVRGMRFESSFLRQSLAQFEPSYAGPLPPPEEAAARSLSAMSQVADRLAEVPDPLLASSLCEAGLESPDLLVRVAAASAYADMVPLDQQARAVQILVEGTYSEDSLVRNVAATALSRVLPGHPRLMEMIQPMVSPEGGEPSHTATIIHGTWARQNDWWQPGFSGNFHEYLKTNVDPSLYSASDRFDWSGSYSDAARALGALDLMSWVTSHGLDGLDLFTHSHGGSVAMLANKAGLNIGRLVLLSCPNHIPKYEPDFTRVGKVVSIRVRMDLVILADRGGQRFNHPKIQENVLPIWFKHSVSHEPKTWIDHNLPSRI